MNPLCTFTTQRSKSLTARLWAPLATALVCSAAVRPCVAQSITGTLPAGEQPAVSLVAAETQPTFSTSAPSDPALPAAALPEAPTPQLAVEPKPKSGTTPAQHVANKNALTIPSDWQAQRLTARDKVVIGARDLYSFENIAAMFLSAGYSELTNGQPNYGSGGEAFGKRLGAAAIRETSQSAFTEMVFAPLTHEDPRYYVKGPNYNPVRRTLYAITRPLITRRDDGSSTVNASLLLGYAGAAALTPAYYPQVNRNFHDVASVYGGSIGGAALGFFVSEFSQDVLRSLHLTRGQ